MTTDTTMTEVDMSDIAAARRERDEMRERAEIAEEALSSLAGEMIYEGNSVSYIYDKMKVYKERVSELAAERDELERLARKMLEAIYAGAIDSQEIDVGDPDIPPHKFHEEWAHHAKRLTAYQRKGE